MPRTPRQHGETHDTHLPIQLLSMLVLSPPTRNCVRITVSLARHPRYAAANMPPAGRSAMRSALCSSGASAIQRRFSAVAAAAAYGWLLFTPQTSAADRLLLIFLHRFFTSSA
jgi:hypothetical protein